METKIKNMMYNEVADYDLNVVAFYREFYSWHADNTLPVFRMYIGVSRRSYIDICVDCTYLLVHNSEHELFNKYCDMLECKVLAYRKKSQQHVAKLNTDLSVFNFLYLMQDILTAQKTAVKKEATKKEVAQVI